MKEPNNVRTLWLHLRLSAVERQTLTSYYQQTTCQGLSAYARSVLLKRPVRVLYRNQSLDDLLRELLRLKRELEALQNTFHQGVQYLQNGPDSTEVKIRLLLHQKLEQTLVQKMEEIQAWMHQIYTLWSQK